jgi:hypothetical protein
MRGGLAVRLAGFVSLAEALIEGGVVRCLWRVWKAGGGTAYGRHATELASG